MARVVKFYETGAPDVLRFEEAEVGDPGPGQVRIRHVAVGLNFADTYFRQGMYPVPLPSGIGNEASGVVEAVGEGVSGLAVGDRVTYTGFINTLGAYSSERLIEASLLIKLPPAIACETAAAMTMRGLSAAYLVRRIYPFQAGDTVLLHAAAGGVGLIVSQWAKLLGLTVIGTVSNEAKAEVARAHGCDHTINYSHEDVGQRIGELLHDAQRLPFNIGAMAAMVACAVWQLQLYLRQQGMLHGVECVTDVEVLVFLAEVRRAQAHREQGAAQAGNDVGQGFARRQLTSARFTGAPLRFAPALAHLRQAHHDGTDVERWSRWRPV